MVTAPCKDCADRKMGCHSICEKYKEFKKISEEEKRIIDKKRREYNDVLGFGVKSSERMRKKKTGKRYGQS